MPFMRKTPRTSQQSADLNKGFIGRANELLYFIHSILEPEEEPDRNIISISGQGGVGKSTLLNCFIDEAHDPDFKDYCITARADERWTTPARIMEHFASQLRDAKLPLRKFEEALGRYKEARRRLKADNEEQILLFAKR